MKSVGRSPRLPTVLFISLPAGLGGSARSLLSVLAGLEAHCRRVVASRPGTSMAAALSSSPRGGSTGPLADEMLELSHGRRAGRVADALRLARWARHHRHELAAIHANGLSELNLAVLAGRVSGAPVVVWIHDWEISRAARILAPLLRMVAPKIVWLTVSDSSRAVVEASRLAGDARVDVVFNPIDPADLGAATEAPRQRGSEAGLSTDGHLEEPVVVGYVGAPARYKGFHLLPAIIEDVARREPLVRWRVWSGPRTAESAVWAALERLPQVELHDKTPDVAQAYAASDIVLCPSLEESFGRVAAESMSLGRPVVASDLPALREVLGDAGTYFRRDDAAAAADAVTQLAGDPTARRVAIERGLRRARDFDPDGIVATLRHHYGLGDGAPRSVLVVTHEATRTGAPAVAAQIARALRDSGVRTEVLSRWPGPLDDLLVEESDAYRLEPFRHARVALRRVDRGGRWANRFDEWVAGRALDRGRVELVWCNTVLSTSFVRPALARGIPVIVHVHELGPLIPGVLRRYEWRAWPIGPGAVTLAACSTEARTQTAAAFGVSETDVHLLESSIDVSAVRRRASNAGERLPGHLGGDAPVVGACGHATERKGIDLWLRIAALVHAQRPECRFVWVGRSAPAHAAMVHGLGLDGVVEMVGELADPARSVRRFDIFTLPSRHDTFSLALLEAMALERPCVAFDAGGAGHQLGDTGRLIEAHDLQAFAAAVVSLLDDPDQGADLGRSALERVRDHFDQPHFEGEVTSLTHAAAARTPSAGPPRADTRF